MYNTWSRNYQLLNLLSALQLLTHPYPFLCFLKLKTLHRPFTCRFYISLLVSPCNFSWWQFLSRLVFCALTEMTQNRANTGLCHSAGFSTFRPLQGRCLAHSSNMYHSFSTHLEVFPRNSMQVNREIWKCCIGRSGH